MILLHICLSLSRLESLAEFKCLTLASPAFHHGIRLITFVLGFPSEIPMQFFFKY